MTGPDRPNKPFAWACAILQSDEEAKARGGKVAARSHQLMLGVRVHPLFDSHLCPGCITSATQVISTLEFSFRS